MIVMILNEPITLPVYTRVYAPNVPVKRPVYTEATATSTNVSLPVPLWIGTMVSVNRQEQGSEPIPYL